MAPKPPPGGLAPVCPGYSCMQKPQLDFLISITLPLFCICRNCFPLQPPIIDFVLSFSMQQENAIRTEASVQIRMSGCPATSMHDVPLGQTSTKHMQTTFCAS